jgi:hypothetical protein
MHATRNRIPKVWMLFLACILLMGEVAWAGGRYSDDWLENTDFMEYWSAGQLLREGHNPYDFGALHELQKEAGREEPMPLIMWNPPWLLVLFYPLLMLPYGAALAIWLGLSVAILLGSAKLVWALFVHSTSPLQLLLPLLAALMFAPALLTVRMGQVSVLILLGVVGFLHFQGKGKDFWAGASLVLLTLKPHVVYLLWIAIAWWIATRRRWKVLWGLGGALLVLCAPLTSLRPTWALDYIQAMRHPPLYWRAPVLGTILRILFGWDRTWLQYLPALILAPLALIALHRRRAVFMWWHAAGPLLLLSVPTAAYGWSLDQIVLLLPYLQAIAWLRERHHRHPISALVVAAGLLSTSGLMLWANQKIGDDLYLVWASLAWGLFYVTARKAMEGQRSETVLAVWDGESA